MLLPTISQQYLEYATAGREAQGHDAAARVIGPYLPSKLRYVMFPVQPGTTIPQLVRPDALPQLRRYLPDFTTTVRIAPEWMALVPAAP